jgi:hypothetical protein
MGKMPKASTPAAAPHPSIDEREDVAVGTEVVFVHMIGGPKILEERAVVTIAPHGIEGLVSLAVGRRDDAPKLREDVPDEEIVGMTRTPRWRRKAAEAAQQPPASPT